MRPLYADCAIPGAGSPTRGGFMAEYKPAGTTMVPMQVTCDEGAFICNMSTADVARMAGKESGILVVMHFAIRIDAMFEGLYELYRTKAIATRSIDFYQRFGTRPRA